MVPWTHLSPHPNGISISSGDFAGPPNMDGWIVFARLRQCAHPCDTCFLGPTQVHNPNGISIGSTVFAQLSADCSRGWPGLSFLLRIASSHGAIWTPPNTCFIGPTRVPADFKGHLDWFSRFCTAHGRRASLYFTVGCPSLKIAPIHGVSGPPSNTSWFLWPTEVLSHNGMDPFSRFCTAHCRVSLYFTMGHPFPLKIAPSYGGCGPPFNTYTWVLNPNSISIGVAVCAGLTTVTDRQTWTDRSRYSLRCGLIIIVSHCKIAPDSFDECRLNARWSPSLKPSESTWSWVRR